MRGTRVAWGLSGWLACTGAAPDAGVAAQKEPAPGISVESPRPIVYACRESAGEPVAVGYRFELDGAAVVPDITRVADPDTIQAGDLVHVGGSTMVLGPPGHYRYFAIPAGGEPPRRGALPPAPDLELSFDGGARRLVALHVRDTIDPRVDLKHLRGLSLTTWNDDVAAALARLDGARLFLAYHVRSFDPGAPRVPPTLPTGLHALRLELDSGFFAATEAEALSLAVLTGLSQLRYLEMDGHTSETIDAGELVRFATLEHLELGGTLPLRQPERLGELSRLRTLGLGWQDGIVDLGFVARLPALHTLDLRRTRATSLEALAGHPGLAVVLADNSPVAALPASPPPRLRRLSLLATRLGDDAVEQFAARAPGAVVDHRWDQRLADVAACATRIHVRSGGLCHRRPESEQTLLVLDDPAAIAGFLPLLRVDEARSDFHCMCCGNPTIELHRDATLLAAIGFHHGQSIRWSGWPGDGALVDPAGLCAWLARHGAAGACSEPGD